MTENSTNRGIGEFVRNAIGLSNDEFEKEMLLDNSDEDINKIEIITLTKDTIEAYDRC
jgi:hypothetical protein